MSANKGAPHALDAGTWTVTAGVRRWTPTPTPDTGPGRPPGRPPHAPVCGTEAGYQAHRHRARRGAPGAVWPLPPADPCGCRAAHRDHERARYHANTTPRKDVA